MMGLGPRSKRSTTMIIEGVICLWGVSSIVTLLFQCNLPAPWDYINGICIYRVCKPLFCATSNTNLTDLRSLDSGYTLTFSTPSLILLSRLWYTRYSRAFKYPPARKPWSWASLGVAYCKCSNAPTPYLPMLHTSNIDLQRHPIHHLPHHILQPRRQLYRRNF